MLLNTCCHVKQTVTLTMSRRTSDTRCVRLYPEVNDCSYTTCTGNFELSSFMRPTYGAVHNPR